MGTPAYSNIYDPIEIQTIIGDLWLKEARVVKSGIANLDTAPIPAGTMIYGLRERIVQDVAAQNVAAGGTIAASVRSQTQTKHPRVFLYGNITEADVLREIETKGATADENAGMAASIQAWALQSLDDSMISVIEGTAASSDLSANQTGSGAVISLDGIVAAIAALGERGMDFAGGGFACNSALYWKMVKLGVVAATSNTYGNVVQDAIVQTGSLPTQVIGMTPIVSDKFDVITGSQYYMYFMKRGALAVRGAGRPVVESARLASNREFGDTTNFMISFGIGFKGMSYGGTAKETISNTDLETAANWSKTYTAANAVGLARFHTASA